MANPKTVKIFCEKYQGIVHPSPLFVTCEDSIEFKAINTALTIFFPKEKLFVDEKPYMKLDPQQEKYPRVGKVTLKNKKALENLNFKIPGSYPYAVYCENMNDFAEGNSSPSMIIED